MESLKSMWAAVKTKLHSLGMEFTNEYNPEMIFLDTLVERVHALEIKMGIEHTDPAPVDHGAAAEALVGEKTATTDMIDSAAALSDFAKKDEIVQGATDLKTAAEAGAHSPGDDKLSSTWNGQRHVENREE